MQNGHNTTQRPRAREALQNRRLALSVAGFRVGGVRCGPFRRAGAGHPFVAFEPHRSGADIIVDLFERVGAGEPLRMMNRHGELLLQARTAFRIRVLKRKRNVRSSTASSASRLRLIATPMLASRTIQRLTLATTSKARTRFVAWNFNPPRSLKVQVFASALSRALHHLRLRFEPGVDP